LGTKYDYCRFEQLSLLAHDFVYVAKSIGRIIISEKYIDNDLKTIKPFKLGGFAGGQIINNITVQIIICIVTNLVLICIA
jgi:hypothetical protein